MSSGHICCRFTNDTGLMKAFENFISGFLTPTFTPYFMICEMKNYETAKQVLISESCISSMCMRGRFDMGFLTIRTSRQMAETTISLCLWERPYPHSSGSDLPLSRFPRRLMAEDSLKSEFHLWQTY